MPPNAAANGNRYWADVGLPYQPARLAATMKVAPEKPNSPRTDGAAIGETTNRVRSSTPARPSVVDRLNRPSAAVVAMWCLLGSGPLGYPTSSKPRTGAVRARTFRGT